jgi:mono/diheme cytochrome c family protein
MKRLPQILAGTAISTFLLFQSVPVQASPSKKESEHAGAALFREKGCAYCHGDAAAGTPKGPSLAAVRKSMNTAQVTDQIENGGQKMPAFGDSLSHDEIMQLVLFLRAKHRPAIPPAHQTASSASPLINPAQ